MPRRPAITQAKVERIIRAAKLQGASTITILPDGAIKIDLASTIVPADDLDRELAEFEGRHGQD